MIEVTVKNSIEGPAEGTALHWHGLLQKKTPWYDGVPSVHMCPIAPGETFVYKFQADIYGSSWWQMVCAGRDPPINYSVMTTPICVQAQPWDVGIGVTDELVDSLLVCEETILRAC